MLRCGVRIVPDNKPLRQAFRGDEECVGWCRWDAVLDGNFGHGVWFVSFQSYLTIVVQGLIGFTFQGCIFMIIISVSPNKESLGTTNGLSQTTVSIARTVAPAVAASLFSFSVERHLLGGYAVYAVLFVLSGSAVLLAFGLPSQRRPED